MGSDLFPKLTIVIHYIYTTSYKQVLADQAHGHMVSNAEQSDGLRWGLLFWTMCHMAYLNIGDTDKIIE